MIPPVCNSTFAVVSFLTQTWRALADLDLSLVSQYKSLEQRFLMLIVLILATLILLIMYIPWSFEFLRFTRPKVTTILEKEASLYKYSTSYSNPKHPHSKYQGYNTEVEHDFSIAAQFPVALTLKQIWLRAWFLFGFTKQLHRMIAKQGLQLFTILSCLFLIFCQIEVLGFNLSSKSVS